MEKVASRKIGVFALPVYLAHVGFYCERDDRCVDNSLNIFCEPLSLPRHITVCFQPWLFSPFRVFLPFQILFIESLNLFALIQIIVINTGDSII